MYINWLIHVFLPSFTKEFVCVSPRNGATGCWSVVFRICGHSEQSPPGAGQQRSGLLGLGGAPAQRGSVVGVCCMPEPPIHVCISTVRSCLGFFFFTGQGDYIGLPGERILTAASLNAFWPLLRWVHQVSLRLFTGRTDGKDGGRLGLVPICGYQKPLSKLNSQYRHRNWINILLSRQTMVKWVPFGLSYIFIPCLIDVEITTLWNCIGVYLNFCSSNFRSTLFVIVLQIVVSRFGKSG